MCSDVKVVGQQVHVALRAAPSTLSTERLLVGKADQKQSDVVSEGVEGGVKQSCTLL